MRERFNRSAPTRTKQGHRNRFSHRNLDEQQRESTLLQIGQPGQPPTHGARVIPRASGPEPFADLDGQARVANLVRHDASDTSHPDRGQFTTQARPGERAVDQGRTQFLRRTHRPCSGGELDLRSRIRLQVRRGETWHDSPSLRPIGVPPTINPAVFLTVRCLSGGPVVGVPRATPGLAGLLGGAFGRRRRVSIGTSADARVRAPVATRDGNSTIGSGGTTAASHEGRYTSREGDLLQSLSPTHESLLLG